MTRTPSSNRALTPDEVESLYGSPKEDAQRRQEQEERRARISASLNARRKRSPRKKRTPLEVAEKASKHIQSVLLDISANLDEIDEAHLRLETALRGLGIEAEGSAAFLDRLSDLRDEYYATMNLAEKLEEEVKAKAIRLGK